MPAVYDATSRKSCWFLLLWLHEINKSNMPFDNWYSWIAQMRLKTVIYDSSGNCRVAENAHCRWFSITSHVFSIWPLLISSNIGPVVSRWLIDAAPLHLNNKRNFFQRVSLYQICLYICYKCTSTPTRTSSSFCATSWTTCGSGERRIIDLYCNLFATLFLLGSRQIEISQNVATKSALGWTLKI